MSNHDGGYLLNDVIGVMNEAQVFSLLGPEVSQQIMLEIINKAIQTYDCNPGEILEGYAAQFGLCACCLATTTELEDELCPECFEPDESDDEDEEEE
jgi:hypothetical protein